MVVVLVIAILLAIAIPTFLGARERSQDRAAQSNLRNALTAAKVAYSNDGNYANATNTHLGAIEPRLNYDTATTPSTAENQVSVAVFDCSTGFTGDNTEALCEATGTWAAATSTCTLSPVSNRRNGSDGTSDLCTMGGTWSEDAFWAGAVWSESETCWFIKDDSESSGTSSGTRYGTDTAAADCQGEKAPRQGQRCGLVGRVRNLRRHPLYG